MIVLTAEDKLTFLEQPIPAAHVPAPDKYCSSRCFLIDTISGLRLIRKLLASVSKDETHFFKKNLEHFRDLHEHTLPKKETTPAVMDIKAGRIPKNKKTRNRKRLLRVRTKGKEKTKLAYVPNPKIPPPPKKDNHAKDTICHQCKENILFPNKYWVYDTGCGNHICNTTQGLRRSKKLKLEALNLFSPNKTSVVYQKTSPRSDLRWKPTGIIFKTTGHRWIHTGKLFDSCTSKADSESTHGFNVDISKIHECKQTLDLSAGTSINVQKEQSIDLSAELESLFGHLFDEHFNGENQVASKSFAITSADTFDKRQQQQDSTSSTLTLATTVTADGNFDL
ncbi:hypothetical protein Tco_1494357 [Tanacetum coccineum]